MKKQLVCSLLFCVIFASSFAQNNLLRGPYLQMANENSITIRWRTLDSTNSKVKYGLSPNNLNDSVLIQSIRKEHIVQITGLSHSTKYFYSIGSSDSTWQGNASNYFITHPPVGSENKYRFWVAGDCGTGFQLQKNVRDQFEIYRANNDVHGFLLLGDNAYNNGLDQEFQTGFFDIYKEQLKHINLWPVPGNHDYWATTNYTQGFLGTPYFKIFTTPQNGEAGGVPSNNPAYYSYNYGNVHFVSIDSYGQESVNAKKLYDTTSAQVVWLKNDLANNTQRWTVLYWHHPPYTKGSHNSDTEGDLVAIRENVLRIIERYKVDLVLNGHSHNYERSFLINGHYGNELSYNPATHNISGSTAIYDGTPNSCPYIKNGPDAKGTIYLVAGNAGKVTFTSPGYPHNAMAFSETVHGGSLMLEVEGNRFDCKFIGDDGVIRDKFTIMKDAGLKQTIGTFPNQTMYLSASYLGSYNWNNNLGNASSISVVPTSPANTYTVSDNESCVKDTFQVNLVSALPTANFSFPSNVCQNTPFQLLDQSTQTPFAWAWTFTGANTNTSNLQNPVVTFPNSGTYNVTLKVTNLLGTSAVYTQSIFVNASTPITLSASSYSACKNNPAIQIYGTPSGGMYSGQGISGNSFVPANASTGINPISYTYVNAAGCKSLANINIVVNPLPIVSVGQIPDSACLNSGPINLSGVPSGGTFSGTGVSNNTYTPIVSASNYNSIFYSYIDNNGCANIDAKQVYVSLCSSSQDEKITDKKIILIYPNPNSGNFIVKLNKNIISEIVLLDEAGRLLRTLIFDKSNNFSLPLTLKEGIYFIQGKIDNVNVREKIVVR
jgi:PKD repeat protein